VPSLAVIGHPVAHSRSPDMQTAALAAMGLAGEWNYGAIDVAPEDFEAEVAELALEGEYAGLNVTIPHKEAALALADTGSDAARAIGAANTLSLTEDTITAENTDAGGLLASLPLGVGGRALVLGAGGAARAAIWALANGGTVVAPPPPASLDDDEEVEATPARQVSPLRVDVWNRTAARAEELAPALGASAVTYPEQSAYDLIVNTTAVGLGGEDPFDHLPLEAGGFAAGQVVVDMVYGEALSPLLAAALEAGATTVDGIEMLVQQGALSLALWLGVPALDPEVIAAMRAAAYGDDPPIA
jgi:shikimate dehydrogenase